MDGQGFLAKPAFKSSLALLAKRADEFGQGSWGGPGRVELEKAIIRIAPLLRETNDLKGDAEVLRLEIQAQCRGLLAKLKSTKISGADFGSDSRAISEVCKCLIRMLD